jgi:hypothetical protein
MSSYSLKHEIYPGQVGCGEKMGGPFCALSFGEKGDYH